MPPPELSQKLTLQETKAVFAPMMLLLIVINVLRCLIPKSPTARLGIALDVGPSPRRAMIVVGSGVKCRARSRRGMGRGRSIKYISFLPNSLANCHNNDPVGPPSRQAVCVG